MSAVPAFMTFLYLPRFVFVIINSECTNSCNCVSYSRACYLGEFSSSKMSRPDLIMLECTMVMGIYLSKALTCMKIFLYKQELLLCQGD